MSYNLLLLSNNSNLLIIMSLRNEVLLIVLIFLSITGIFDYERTDITCRTLCKTPCQSSQCQQMISDKYCYCAKLWKSIKNCENLQNLCFKKKNIKKLKKMNILMLRRAMYPCNQVCNIDHETADLMKCAQGISSSRCSCEYACKSSNNICAYLQKRKICKKKYKCIEICNNESTHFDYENCTGLISQDLCKCEDLCKTFNQICKFLQSNSLCVSIIKDEREFKYQSLTHKCNEVCNVNHKHADQGACKEGIDKRNCTCTDACSSVNDICLYLQTRDLCKPIIRNMETNSAEINSEKSYEHIGLYFKYVVYGVMIFSVLYLMLYICIRGIIRILQ